MAKRKSNVEEQLWEAIKKSKMSCYQISKLADVTESQLSLFVNRKRTLTLTSAAKVAEVLGLIIKNVPQDKESKKMGVIKRTKAMNIQLGITQRLKRLRAQEKLTPKDFDYLDKRTHELYNLAKEAGKLKEIAKIIER
jgi:hypothetical protein